MESRCKGSEVRDLSGSRCDNSKLEWLEHSEGGRAGVRGGWGVEQRPQRTGPDKLQADLAFYSTYDRKLLEDFKLGWREQGGIVELDI